MKPSVLLIPAIVHLLPPFCGANGIADHDRILVGDRTSTYDSEGLICQIGRHHTGDSTMVRVDFNFYYAMGIRGEVDSNEMLDLEEALFKTVKDDMLWCWKEKSEMADSGNDRRLSVAKEASRQRFTQAARDLGIIAFTPGKMDEQLDDCKLSRALRITSLFLL